MEEDRPRYRHAAAPAARRRLRSETMSVDDIKECIERSGPKRSSVQEATLRTVDESGGTKESEARLYWRKFDDGLSRALIRFDAPPDLRGSALLLIEKEGEDTDVYMYLPEFRQSQARDDRNDVGLDVRHRFHLRRVRAALRPRGRPLEQAPRRCENRRQRRLRRGEQARERSGFRVRSDRAIRGAEALHPAQERVLQRRRRSAQSDVRRRAFDAPGQWSLGSESSHDAGPETGQPHQRSS